MSSRIPDRYQYDCMMHTYFDTIDKVHIPASYFKQEKPMRKLSKKDEMDLMFSWNEDKNLSLIYRTFEKFVEAKVGKYVREGDI